MLLLNSQDFTTPQISFEFSGIYYTSKSFSKNQSTQTIRKLALFEKSCHGGKKEAKTGWSNVDREPQKIGCKLCGLNQSDSKQHNTLH